MNQELFVDGKPNLLHCPLCGKSVEVHGGQEEWSPTYNDPDSGGEQYHIDCECGLRLGGFYDIEDIIRAWNNRYTNWIPVSRELPKLDEDGYAYVLVSMDDEFVATTDFTKDEGFELWEDSGEVIAWMPKPEPYRPEGDHDKP